MRAEAVERHIPAVEPRTPPLEWPPNVPFLAKALSLLGRAPKAASRSLAA